MVSFFGLNFLLIFILQALEVIFGAIGGCWCDWKQVGRAKELMMRSRVMLGVIVGLVEAAPAPVDVKLALSDPVADPIKAHVDGL